MGRRGVKVLNVAEKPSVAKEITRLLSGGNTTRVSRGMNLSASKRLPSGQSLQVRWIFLGRIRSSQNPQKVLYAKCHARPLHVLQHASSSQYNSVVSFHFTLSGQPCEMFFTSVRG